jgi:hypothetical protein
MFASNEDLSLNLTFRPMHEQFNNCVHVRVFISKNANYVLQMLALEVDGYYRFGTNQDFPSLDQKSITLSINSMETPSVSNF